MPNKTETLDRTDFDTVKKCVTLFGIVGAITLGTVAVMAVIGQPATSFMWVRAAILLAAAPVLQRMAVRAARGERRAFARLRTLTVILPIAIVAVDLIPGVCPMWYAAMQGISALALVGAAVLLRR
jgi:hypothetical protein